MKVISEIDLSQFDFWSGGATNAAELTNEQLDQVGYILEDIYPDGMTDTQINDLFWFDFDTVKEWVGLTIDKDKIEDVMNEYGDEIVLDNGTRVELSVYEARNGDLTLCGDFTYTDADGEEESETVEVEIDKDADSAEDAFYEAVEELKEEVKEYF